VFNPPTSPECSPAFQSKRSVITCQGILGCGWYCLSGRGLPRDCTFPPTAVFFIWKCMACCPFCCWPIGLRVIAGTAWVCRPGSREVSACCFCFARGCSWPAPGPHCTPPPISADRLGRPFTSGCNPYLKTGDAFSVLRRVCCLAKALRKQCRRMDPRGGSSALKDGCSCTCAIPAKRRRPHRTGQV